MITPDICSDASSTGFPGFGEDAPLDLSGLTEYAVSGLLARLADHSFDAWADTAAGVGYCSHPIRLVGSSETVDPATGEVLSSFSSADAPLGLLYRPCGNRRANVCPACSRVYARDSFAMIKAGMAGGKTVPETVADNPLLFGTFTAPSFGPVHGPRGHGGQKTGGRCRPRDKSELCPHGRPVGCMIIHDDHDPRNGVPLCDDCNDWDSSIVWQWWAPELWRRTTTAIRREIATRLGLTEHQLGRAARVEFAKVAEYQARGLVHFHALIRLDGSDGPGSPAPLDGDQLAACVRAATASMIITAPPVDDQDRIRRLAWGRELDVRVVRDGLRSDDPNAPLTPDQVAAYLAKYATKGADNLRPGSKPPAHLVRLEQTARDLGRRAIRHDPGLRTYQRLAQWAHMLGFRGHFATKSRRYSITLTRLRRARHRYRQLVAKAREVGEQIDTRDLDALLLADDTETTLVIGSWRCQGTGWTNPGDEALANAAAARAREYAVWRASKITNSKINNSKIN